MADDLVDASVVGRALEMAAQQTGRSIEALATLVRIRSLTGEEGEAQAHLGQVLEDLGLDVQTAEPDIAGLFEAFPTIAQYPTHWRHDLILPYDELPTYAALVESGLSDRLNYRNRPNLVAVMPGTGGGRSLILNSHIDTVTIEPAEEWTRDPFGAATEDGLMYGRGTSDMKGGVMAAVMALTFMREAGMRLSGDVVFQCVVNEEHSGNGTLDLIRRGYRADAAIVLEPTNNAVFVSHPGGLYWEVRVPGISRSPGARFEDGRQVGVSAIEKVPLVIAALSDLERALNREVGERAPEGGRHPFSLVMGRISGGHYETVTAGEATLRGVAYFGPAVGAVEDVMRRFREAIADANAADGFLSDHPAHITFLHHDDSTLQDDGIAVARQMSDLLGRRGGDRAIGHGPFCCDMRHLVNQGGIPAIIFGPGTIAQAHKPDEHIRIAEYVDCIDHLIAFIGEWCG